jgi:outer membrane biosynthesis protein TonB
VNILLADPPALANPEQPPTTETPGATPPGPAPESPETATAPQPTCKNCGAAMIPGQDWCLQCGAGAPGSLDGGGPSWRSAAVILTATAVLVLGAAAAAFAALDKESAPKAHSTIVAVAPTPTAVTPTPTTPVTPTPPTPGAVTPTPKASETPAVTPLPSTGSTTPPKIPLTAPTPKSSGTTTTPAKTNESSGTTPAGGGKSGSGAESGTKTGSQPVAITLDPDAASTYNPYGYPESEFGDPSLAIDGDTSTAWTAQVNPAVAPKMAEGLVIDLKSARRLSAVGLITSTPGMSVQVYGANGSAPPTSITDPAWTQLSPYLVEKKHNDRIKLQNSAKAFRFIALWISKAPAASVGTAQAPGHVAVNELELFPTAR